MSTSHTQLGNSFNFNAYGNTWRLSNIPSLFNLSNVDIFTAGKDQFRPDSHHENKFYSPFNDYFGLANIIRGSADLTMGDKEQVHPLQSNTLMMERNLLKLRNTWHSNDSIHNNIKQSSSEREHYRFDNGMQKQFHYGESLTNTNAIWNSTDTDSSTHTSPLTPSSQTFTTFPTFHTGVESDLRMGGVQHHIVSMLHAEAKLKAHARAHTGSLGDEDSLSDGSNNGIGSGRGMMSSAVTAALANGVTNINGPDDNKYQRHRRVKLCVFCRNNGKPEEDYKDHILKDSSGRVVCPILRAYVCPTCGESGDNAHTLKYCPATQPTIIYSPGIPDNGMQW